MYIETNRLIIRDLMESDARMFYDIKYDKQVLENIRDYVKVDATLEDMKEAINYCNSVKDTSNFEREVFYAIVLKETKTIIGTITVSKLEYLYETQIGWQVRSEYTGQGYASEAGKAISDYLLEHFGYEYIVVILAADNIASFKTALKSGFKLFEKRVPYDYIFCNCDHENFNEVSKHFLEKEKEIWSSYFYFRKFNPNIKIKTQFYGDRVYDGRYDRRT